MPSVISAGVYESSAGWIATAAPAAAGLQRATSPSSARRWTAYAATAPTTALKAMPAPADAPNARYIAASIAG